jgi:adenylylsulfate kinase
MIVLMAGLPGTGKSALAEALAAQIGGSVLSKDKIRQALFGRQHVHYSATQDDFVMRLMLDTTGWLLNNDPRHAVFLDGRTFSRRYQIDQVVAAANQLHQPWHILECVCSAETARARIESQEASGEHPAENRTFQLYLDVKARFEPITLPKTLVDTDAPLEECVNHALHALR